MKGLVTLVTGGASGLGAATVHRVLQQGGRVAVADLPSSQGKEMVEKFSSDHAVFTPMDVSSEEDVKKSLEIVKNKYGRLDACVNCAGIGVAALTYKKSKDAVHKMSDFERALRVNALGTWNVSRLSAQLMAQNEPGSLNERGVIINTASVAAFDGQSGQTAYSASKGAIVSMTLPMARDLSSLGIRVNAIAPGLFMTPLLQNLPSKVIDKLGKTVPFPARIGDPEWFAQMVESLITNPYVNGEVIRVDGALRMNP